ncbi:early nodulin-like protein 9 [Tasmannia lanceolata]|uniref:early nodulin-like protein 9 n=1 Tax=Tasmannia lanceolata TaxID=3420 RepID=UPI0040634148
MANTTLRLHHHSKAFHAFASFVLLMLMHRADATEFRVGSTNEWKVPTDPNAMPYNKWAEMNRFQIGDSLLFVYQPDQDSVLYVNKDDYNNCNTEAPFLSFKDGNTSFKFNHSGAYYFISGVGENCNRNEKVAVVVMADRSNKSSSSNPPSNASPPSPSEPSGSPPAETTPSMAPVGKEYPPPPPPPSGASSIVVSFMGSFGAILGSFFLFVL